MNSFSAHFCNKFLRIIIRQILIVFWKIINNIKILFFSKKITCFQ